jgi:CheY-like chemotaxis protein/anti-sigma regulatory factor (Ser/Thr protein kinase)
MAAKARNIRLVVREFHGQVISDPVLLERIVMNLVSNALRYTSANGTVMIACRRRFGQVVIEVRDNGIGIEKTHQAAIFREFFQLHQNQIGSQKGLGLGLAIVDRLARLLGHKIALRSAPDKGSRFTLSLEGALASDGHIAPSAGGLERESYPLTGKKVLIVDGDGPVLDGTARIIASWGGEITAVSSLKSVKLLLSKGARWDLVISDYQVNCNVTGLDIIKTVRQHLCTQTPGILISTDTSDSLLKLANYAGYPLLHKPVKPAKLRSLVQFLLGGGAVSG